MIVACFVVVLALGANVALGGEEDPVRFLHALQARGYGDMAVEYLNAIKDRPRLPRELRETWDLEMSRSLKLAANEAFDAKERDALVEQSQKHLAKFVKEKADQPEATVALMSWADFTAADALELLQRSKNEAGKESQKGLYEKHVNEARAGLLSAQEKYREAEKKFLEKLESLPVGPKPSAKKAERNEAAQTREAIENSVEEARFQVRLLDYYLTQLDADPKSDEHIEALKKSAQALDDFFQRNRARTVGLYAHMWNGKIVDELGDDATALDIYDEVLASAPEPTEKGVPSGYELLFPQVEQFRLNILARRKPLKYLPEAIDYLKNNERLKQSSGYQGIALDAVKALIDRAENASGSEKKKQLSEAMRIATDGSRVPGPYQRELFDLRHDLLRSIGRNLEVNTLDDAMAAGKAAEESSQWAKALENYDKAMAFVNRSTRKDPQQVAAVREATDHVRFLMACDLYAQGKMDECLAMVGSIVRDADGRVKANSVSAAQASALGIQAALSRYATASKGEKEAALQKLLEIARFTEKNWPDRPEADDARLARGHVQLVDGHPDEAIAVFEQVHPKSERYATAMYLAGRTYWVQYVTEKLKSDGKPDAERMVGQRAKAIERLQTAWGLLKRRYAPGGLLPPYLLETQLLLGEIALEGGNANEAASLFQPLIEAIEAEKSRADASRKTFDASELQVFLGAVRAYGALDALDRAGAVCASLIEIGPDTPQVNDALANFAKLLNRERKQADARVVELSNSANADEVSAATARQAAVTEMLKKTVVRLASRKQMSLGNMAFVGKTLNDLDQTDMAGELFQAILKKAQSDPEYAKQAKKAMGLIRSELVKILRKQKKFDEALQQVERLIEENPNALEPMMEKGYILEALAEKDPAKWAEVVTHWTSLRNRMQGMVHKPNEYYDVMYNVAGGLVRQAEASQDKALAVELARMAEQVLKSPMILTPKLNGPDTVMKYKALVHRAMELQGRSPEKKGTK